MKPLAAMAKTGRVRNYIEQTARSFLEAIELLISGSVSGHAVKMAKSTTLIHSRPRRSCRFCS
jgi:hypothetical protein